MTLVNEILRIRHLDLLVAPNLVDYFTYKKLNFLMFKHIYTLFKRLKI